MGHNTQNLLPWNSLHILQATWPNYVTYITLGKVLGTSVPFRSLLSLVSFVNFLSTVNFTYFLNFSKPLSQRTFWTESNQFTTESTLETPRGQQLVVSASGPFRKRVVPDFQYGLYVFCLIVYFDRLSKPSVKCDMKLE